MRKRFTVGDVADAIEKNGLTQARGYFFRGKNMNRNMSTFFPSEKIGSACAIGQACINLGVKTDSWVSEDFYVSDLLGWVVNYNDGDGMTFKEIADLLRKKYDLDLVIQAETFDYEPYL